MSAPDTSQRSWWEGVSRTLWPQVQAHCEVEMAGTRFDKLNQLSTAISVSSEDETRWRKAKAARAQEEATL